MSLSLENGGSGDEGGAQPCKPAAGGNHRAERNLRVSSGTCVWGLEPLCRGEWEPSVARTQPHSCTKLHFTPEWVALKGPHLTH